MRLLVLSRYDALGASSRLRMLQYVPALREAGFDVDVQALLDDRYVQELYDERVSKAHVARLYFRRLRMLPPSGKHDAIWVEKELFPWFPALFERGLISKRTALALDYDDAVFHRYDSHKSGLVRALLGRKIDALMARADLVTAGNEYLAEHARNAGSRHVALLPTVVDLDRYPQRPLRIAGEPLTIGWIGSPATAGYLDALDPVMRQLRERHAIRCVAIGARGDQVSGSQFERWEWSADTEVTQLQHCDIGIMPLPDAPWERGKCGYKLVQYMACGLPVVASPVGANRQIVIDGDNGFLAADDRQWLDALERLLVDDALRERMGASGRRMVEQTYSLQAQVPHLVGMLHDLGSTGSR